MRGLFLTLPTKERLLGLGVFEGTGCGTANKMEGDCWDLESLRGLVVALSTKGRLLGLGVFEGTVSDTANKRAIVGIWCL